MSRDLRVEIDERVAANGEILKTAAEVDFSPIMEKFRESGVESIAIAFMNAYRNDANEAAALAKTQALAGDIPVRFTGVVPEKGEFERFSTCVLTTGRR